MKQKIPATIPQHNGLPSSSGLFEKEPRFFLFSLMELSKIVPILRNSTWKGNFYNYRLNLNEKSYQYNISIKGLTFHWFVAHTTKGNHFNIFLYELNFRLKIFAQYETHKIFF